MRPTTRAARTPWAAFATLCFAVALLCVAPSASATAAGRGHTLRREAVPAVPDPAQPGPYPSTKVEYDAGATLVDDPSSHVTYAARRN